MSNERARVAGPVRGGPAGSGFTLVELMVAMFITVLLGTVVVTAYNTSMQSYYRTEKQLQALAAFRNTADRLEREVNSMVFKASVYPHPVLTRNSSDGWFTTVLWDTQMKFLNGDAWVNSDPYSWNIARDGAAVPVGSASPALPAGDWWKINPNGKSLYQVNFRPRYMGYYSSLDGFTIDRTEWYYNPPEERQKWANGLDDDADDPDGDGGLRILYDDRGCLMFRKRFDKDMAWREWDLVAGSPNEYRDPYHGPYSGYEFPPADRDSDGVPDELVGPVMNLWDNNGDGVKDNVDTGTVIGENFADLRFYYLYKLRTSDQFIYADWWPWDNDSDPTSDVPKTKNTMDPNMPTIPVTCYVGGSWVDSGGSVGVPRTSSPQRQVKYIDIAYFSLPMAISVRFTFSVGTQRHVYEKLIYLHASRWLKYLNP